MSVTAIGSAVAAVQARIGQLEQVMGVRRQLPVVRSTTSGAPATSASSAGSSTASSAAVTATAAAAASIAADPSLSFADVLDSASGATGASNEATSGGAASASTAIAGSSDLEFEAAVAELRSRWNQPYLWGTSAPTETPSTAVSSTLQTVGSVGSVGSVASSGGAESQVSPTTPYASLFESAADRYGVPAKVLAAIGYVESRFQTDAVSSAGAVGMMQFLPTTAASMGVDPYDPASAIDGTARYLRSALDRFGSIEQAIASYNVGPGSIARSGGVQPGSQAERYLTQVLDATGLI
jgi:peptidoglycan DL-endopeptidase CwlO